jgi:tryptophan halogenase
MPRAHHPIAAKLSDKEMAGFLMMIRDGIAKTARSLPPHYDYVLRYCGAQKEQAA